MKRNLKLAVVCLLALCMGSLAAAKDKKPKPGPLTGTWECTSHGGSQGDLPFTLYLEQQKEDISGSVSSPIGGTQITSGSFKKKVLEIRLETPNGNYLLTGKLNKGALSGNWSTENEKGTWEGNKQAAAAASK